MLKTLRNLACGSLSRQAQFGRGTARIVLVFAALWPSGLTPRAGGKLLMNRRFWPAQDGGRQAANLAVPPCDR
jgi:hypothetical protein